MAATPAAARRTPNPSAFEALPEDIAPSLAQWLDVSTMSHLSITSSTSMHLNRNPEVWRVLTLSHLWPFSEEVLTLLASGWMLPCLTIGCGRNGWHHKAISLTKPVWPGLWKAYERAKRILVIDVGFGYTKYSSGAPERASSDLLPEPAMLQLCSSPTHPSDAVRHRQLRNVVNRAKDRPPNGSEELFLCEPFGLKTQEEIDAWREGFVRKQLPGGTRYVFCPQPMLAMVAHGVYQDGLVINIGQRETVVVPCLEGHVFREGIQKQEGLGSSMLTQVMLDMLMARNVGVDWDMLTWCRDLKEKYCVVAPEALDPNNIEAAAGLVGPVEVGFKRLRLELSAERVLVPEVLFRNGPASLLCLISRALGQVIRLAQPEKRVEILARLLKAVVVVGGTAEIPGLKTRLQLELQSEVDSSSYLGMKRDVSRPIKVNVLSPLPGLGTPRTAVLRGGQTMAIALCAAGLADYGKRSFRASPFLTDDDLKCPSSPSAGDSDRSYSWRRPTRLLDLRDAVQHARQSMSRTTAAVCSLWRSALGRWGSQSNRDA